MPYSSKTVPFAHESKSCIVVAFNCALHFSLFIPAVSLAVQRIYINFSLFPARRRRGRSTLSALRLSKLSRRDETRLNCGAQIPPSFPFFFCLERPAARWFWTKAIKRMHRWRSYADSFIIPVLLFVQPSCCFLPLLHAAFPTSGPLQHSVFSISQSVVSLLNMFINCYVLCIYLSFVSFLFFFCMGRKNVLLTFILFRSSYNNS